MLLLQIRGTSNAILPEVLPPLPPPPPVTFGEKQK